MNAFINPINTPNQLAHRPYMQLIDQCVDNINTRIVQHISPSIID